MKKHKKALKRVSAILLSVFLLISVPAFPVSVSAASAEEETVAATSGTSGDCSWTNVNGTVTISGEGRIADYQSYTDSPQCKTCHH